MGLQLYSGSLWRRVSGLLNKLRERPRPRFSEYIRQDMPGTGGHLIGAAPEDEKLWRAGRGFVVRDLPWSEEKLRAMLDAQGRFSLYLANRL